MSLRQDNQLVLSNLSVSENVYVVDDILVSLLGINFLVKLLSTWAYNLKRYVTIELLLVYIVIII